MITAVNEAPTAQSIHKKRELPPYGVFCLTFLGFNFQRERDGAIFSKSEFYDLPYNDDSFTLVRYSPPEGWPSKQAERLHFERVTTIRRENGIPAPEEIAGGRYVYWSGWVDKWAHRDQRIVQQSIRNIKHN